LNYIAQIPSSINLFLRLRLKENTIKTERFFAYGMSYRTINKKIREIKSNPKISSKIEQLGIHFHRKTQNISEWDILSDFKEIIDEDIFSIIDAVNIGGGLPSLYKNTNVKVFNGIINKLIKLRNWLHNKNIKLIMEPGRFIAAPSGELITHILRIYQNKIIINASVYNSNLDALILSIKLLVKGELETGTPYLIKGSTPCSMDIFRYRVYLENPKEGDQITFLNAGAYNYSADLCNLKKIKTIIIE